jgi:hypothetical protein
VELGPRLEDDHARAVTSAIYLLLLYERGMQETLGQNPGSVASDLGLQIPFARMVRVRDVREHSTNFQRQAVTARDNVEIRVDGIMEVRPAPNEASIKGTFSSIDDWKH